VFLAAADDNEIHVFVRGDNPRRPSRH
jgi:hypothetical protein